MNKTYAYDSLNRLKDFNFTGTEFPGTNHYAYAMDEYGNLLGEQKVYANPWAPTGMSGAVDAATNRLSGRPHDALGNLTQIEGPDGGTLTLDYLDQGHVARVTGGSGGEYRYYYDADGKRRLKAKGPQAACTGYSLSFYEGEDLVCQVDAGDAVQPDAAYQSKYLLTDHLGTTRAELTGDAQGAPQITQTYDTMPYGELLDPPENPLESILFTGKQRDNESDLDYFGARFFSDDLLRWVSIDPLLESARVENPMSWDRYNYCFSNPVRYLDPDGRDVKVEDQLAFKLILGSLPSCVANQITLNADGTINKDSINKINSNDSNFLALKELVNSPSLVEVATAPGWADAKGNSFQFTFQSKESLYKDLVKSLGKAEANSLKNQLIDDDETGYTLSPSDSKTGNLRVIVADNKGKTATAPMVVLVTTMAEELFGHSLLYTQGKKWEHEIPGPGPVNAYINQVRTRTETIYKANGSSRRSKTR